MKKLLLIIFFFGCAPITISDLQSAKVIDKGKFEFTPSYSKTNSSMHYGFQAAYGLNKNLNLRFRYEKIKFTNFIPTSSPDFINTSIFNDFKRFTHLSIGIKSQLKKNKSAIYIPLSITRLDYNTMVLLKSIEPTYLRTFRLNKYLDITPSLKSIFNIEEQGILLAWNIGLGFSNDKSKWALRAEVGNLLFTSVYHNSIGLSIYP